MFRPGGKSEWTCGVVAEHGDASEGRARPGSVCGVVAKDCVTPVPLTPITFRWVISYQKCTSAAKVPDKWRSLNNSSRYWPPEGEQEVHRAAKCFLFCRGGGGLLGGGVQRSPPKRLDPLAERL